MAFKEQILAKQKVLICDNDVRLSNRLYIWLSGLKVEVHIAHDHDKAIELFTLENPDIIITSAMHSGEGIALIKAIKNFNENAGIVFIFKDDSAELFKEVVTLNIDKYVHLPVETPKLLDILYRLAKDKLISRDYAQQEHLLKEYRGAIDKIFIVSIHNYEGDITYVNDSFCSTFNIDKAKALEGYVNPILHQTDSTKRDAMLQVIHNKGVWQDRQVIVVNKVDEHIFDVHVIPLLNADGVILEFLVLMKDVTQLVLEGRRAQAEKKDNKIEKLQMLRKHHQEVNRVKDSFLTIFAHELRTPLNAIINFSGHLHKHISKSDIAKKKVLTSEAYEIKKSGATILEMINNMIDAIKLRDKKMLFVREPFNLAACIEETVANCEYAQEVNFTVELDKAVNINSDETRFAQLLKHILSNAVKYGNKEIMIALKSKDNSFLLTIEDNGNGFDFNEKVFELFNQAEDDDMTRSAKGLGIGLFVVKQICMNLDLLVHVETSKRLGGANVVIRENIEEIEIS